MLDALISLSELPIFSFLELRGLGLKMKTYRKIELVVAVLRVQTLTARVPRKM